MYYVTWHVRKRKEWYIKYLTASKQKELIKKRDASPDVEQGPGSSEGIYLSSVGSYTKKIHQIECPQHFLWAQHRCKYAYQLIHFKYNGDHNFIDCLSVCFIPLSILEQEKFSEWSEEVQGSEHRSSSPSFLWNWISEVTLRTSLHYHPRQRKSIIPLQLTFITQS